MNFIPNLTAFSWKTLQFQVLQFDGGQDREKRKSFLCLVQFTSLEFLAR